MTSRWDEMTVAELRKYAREHGITLSAGINKQGIIERITSYESSPEQLSMPETSAPSGESAAENEPGGEQPRRPVRRASIISDDDDESHEISYGMGGYARPQTERPRYSSDPIRAQQNTGTRTGDVLSTISSKAPAFHIDSGTKAWHNPRSFQPSNYHAPSAPASPRSRSTKRSAATLKNAVRRLPFSATADFPPAPASASTTR